MAEAIDVTDWRIAHPRDPGPGPGMDLDEWLITNGLGGYASGTVAGVPTRRFHGLLVAGLHGQRGRVMMLNHVSAWLRLPDGRLFCLDPPLGDDPAAAPDSEPGARPRLADLVEFGLERGLPLWRYQVGPLLVERRAVLPHMQNTVHILYRVARGEGSVRLKLRPALHIRPHEGRVDAPLPADHTITATRGRYEIAADGEPEMPPLRLVLHGPQTDGEGHAFTIQPHVIRGVEYPLERSRGYDWKGDLYSPGYFRANLAPGREVALVASTESWEAVLALQPADAFAAERERRRRLLSPLQAPARPAAPPPGEVPPDGPVAETLVLAADQFLITPAGRTADAARARAAGDDVRTVIAGYHWFTDWGRDTMISLEGLTLCTGRQTEARYILLTFSHAIRDGLIPNLFPEGTQQGLYHTADATLWFFHAIDRYVRASGDRETLRQLLPRLQDIIACHRRGTRFGIHVDPRDGLLSQGQEGYQLTWMDAKVGDWVVTPRRGKAVEINALWYNALRLCEGWTRDEQGEAAARPYGECAEQARRSFNARFWYQPGCHLYDVVDGERGDDPACRPNQVFAISLPHPVLDPARWAPVLQVVQERLLTPVGLRSLAPGEPDFKPRYDGDLRARDAAYHQGTVWAWLIGPFIDAWLKVNPGQGTAARRFLQGLVPHLGHACIGSISEIFDAEPPFTPRGCIAQAWSVAEVLRCWHLSA